MLNFELADTLDVNFRLHSDQNMGKVKWDEQKMLFKEKLKRFTETEQAHFHLHS